MENIPFFDPYTFMASNNIPTINTQQTNVTKNNSNDSVSKFQPPMSPKEFYENQYIYYRYLNEVLEYQIKRDEYDKKIKNENNERN